MADNSEYQALCARSEALGKAVPDVMKAFGALHGAVVKEGALTVKTKELIALMISVIVKCHPCIQAHTRGCIAAGVTREELAEAIGVAVMMGGGPATAYGGIVLDLFDQLKK